MVANLLLATLFDVLTFLIHAAGLIVLMLFASLEGVTGFLIMGWSAAYLVTTGIRFGPFERDKHF
jgi:hypothetical protein